ncbi:MAG: HGGxSTG domain-containing protein [Janthinobacterium lividum]
MSIDPTNPMRRGPIALSVSKNYSCRSDAAIMPPSCGAKTRSGVPCRSLAMRNGRCRMHGGASTGPKTSAGLLRSQTSTLVHGGKSREMIEFRRRMRELQADARRMIEAV